MKYNRRKSIQNRQPNRLGFLEGSLTENNSPRLFDVCNVSEGRSILDMHP